jgi:hypothetical protein
MTHLAPPAAAIASHAAADHTAHADERLPIGQSALIIAALSLGLWAGIGLLVRWAIG